MAVGRRPLLVGRERELTVLRATLDNRSRAGSLAIVRGDPGTGKSALLEEAASYAEASGRRVLRAAGFETEATMPFAGLHQLLRPVLPSSGLTDRQRDALDAAFGSTGPPALFLVGLATLSLLGDLADKRALAVLIDDAHWLDTPTLEVLDFLVHRLEADPIVLVLTSRERLSGTLDASAGAGLQLSGLDEAHAHELLDERFPDLNPAVRQNVLDLAAGNPLALTELPSVLERHPGEFQDGALPLTSRLERAFAVRMLDLPSPTQSLLLVMAYGNEDSLESVLAATSELVTHGVALDDLEPAEAGGLVSVEASAVRFRHPLMRSAVRLVTTTPQRHAVHEAWARALQDHPGKSVWHRAACATGADESLAAELDDAASRLQQRHEAPSAIAALRRAAELTPSYARKGARLVAAAGLALDLGRFEEVTELNDKAEALDIEAHTRHMVLWLRGALTEASGTSTAESLIAVAQQLVTDGDDHLALEVLFAAAVRCFMFRDDAGVASGVLRLAESVSSGDDASRLAAISGLATPAAPSRRVLEELADRTPEHLSSGTPAAEPVAGEALHLEALALTSVGEFRLAVGYQEAAIASLRSQGRLRLLARALGSQSASQIALGEWRHASQSADECLRLIQYVRGSPTTASDGERVLNAGWSLLALATVAANRGEPSLGQELVDEANQVLGWVGSNFSNAGIQAARSSAALALGRPAEAFQHAARIFDPEDIAFHPSVCRWGNVLRDLVDSARASGNAEKAAQLIRQLSRESETAEAAGTFAYVDAVLAEDDIEARFRVALATAPPSRYFQARVHIAVGKWLRRERRLVEARNFLQRAIEGFDVVTAVPWAERARQELRATGESVVHKHPEQRDELTPQEMQIAQLAAQGLSNREIGEMLFLSHRTVGSHLYRTFPKLDITSRTELATALERLPD
jgi:DNA-binding CsgD family transcriptional regulator